MITLPWILSPFFRLRRVFIIATLIILYSIPAVIWTDSVSANNIAAIGQTSEVCFAVADERDLDGGGEDSADTLTRINRFTGEPEIIGLTGTQNIEEIAFGPGHQLYATNGGRLGTLDINSGAFTPLSSPAGTAVNGARGTIVLNDLDGLAYSLTEGVFFATHRPFNQAPPAPNPLDVLVALDPATGAHIPGYFNGDDYVEVSEVSGDFGPLRDVDGLAIDPVTGLLYAAINDSGQDGVLATIDPATGTATKLFTFRFADGEIIDDIEAISFFNDGTLYASSGDNFTGDADDLNAF
jgi:hypothetical protein